MHTQSELSQEALVLTKESSIFRNKGFLLAIASLVFNCLGTSVFTLAESWYIVNYLGFGNSLGIILMLAAVPRLVLMPMGGVIADRYKRTHIMFVSDASRGVLLLVMTLLFITNNLSFMSMAVFALLFGVLDAFYWPTSSSLIPTIVSNNHLAQANSIYQLIQQVLNLSGPLIGGIILTFGSYSVLFGSISVIIFLGAFLSLYIGKYLHFNSEQFTEHLPFKEELKGGFVYIQTEPFIKMLMITLMMAGFLISGPLSMAVPLLVDNVLHGNALDLSYLELSVSVGMILGSVVVALAKIKQRRMLWSMSGLTVCGICLLLLGFSRHLVLLLILLFMCGLVLCLSNTFFITLLQERTPTEKIGRVMSLVSTSTAGLLPLSHLTISLVLNGGLTISHVLIMFGGGISLFCIALISYSKTVRTT